MKNLITDFTVFVNEKYSFLPLTEDDKKGSISGLTNKVSVIGSTKSKTKNSEALAALKKHYTELKSTFDVQSLVIKGEPSDNNAYFDTRGKSEFKPKTEKNKTDYIKLGDEIILDGDKGGLVSKTITYKQLMNNKLTLEASGNGIYIIGRILTAILDKKFGLDQTLKLYMNLKKPININMDVDTGIGGGASLNNNILALMVIGKIIKPLEGNMQNPVEIATSNNTPEGYKKIVSGILNYTAIPSISLLSTGKGTKEKLINSDAKEDLDATEKVKQYANKNLEFGQIEKAVEIYKDLYKTFNKPFYQAIGDRLKQAITIECEASGVELDTFEKMFKDVDQWVKNSTSEEIVKKAIDKQTQDKTDKSLATLLATKKKEPKDGPNVMGLTSHVNISKGKEGAFR